METLNQIFEERLKEIEAYLDLLDALERQLQTGPPHIGATTITVQQQRILYSSVYLQLYNLVEATVTWCVNAVSAAVAKGSLWFPGDLTDSLLREWARSTARTHVDLGQEKRLDSAVALCRLLINNTPLSELTIEKRSNWDDNDIQDITARIGFDLKVEA